MKFDCLCGAIDPYITTVWNDYLRISMPKVHIENLMLLKAQDSNFGSRTHREAFEGKSSANMAVLSRYERSLENAFFRALQQFKSLQDQKKLEMFSPF